MSPRIFFSVGEPSGDQHAAHLIDELLKIDSQIQIRGFGGPAMREAGCRIDVELTQHAVMGFLEVLPKLRQFFRFTEQAEALFQHSVVDAVILVDFPGFNWHIAKAAKKHGIPVFYYCPPQLWAWGKWRLKKMRRTVDEVLAVLPVEEQFFTSNGIHTTYVGHPFFDAVHQSELHLPTLERFAQERLTGKKLVAVLPGSRRHEVERNWPLMLEAIRRIHRSQPDVKFLVAAYRENQCLFCRNALTTEDQRLPIDFYVGRTSEIIEASECAMMVSGSVSLELMARKTPAVVIYRIGRFFYEIGKRLVNLDSFTLPNLMGKGKVYPEFISVGNPEPAIEMLASSINRFLGDTDYSLKVREELQDLADQFATPGASNRAAHCILSKLSARSGKTELSSSNP
ncbi:lipid-A-disaccharide synthase [Rhodopirellula sp.]|nr:lipid-A-disaccharide synthase [Rhodopirellula sp.]